VTPSFPETGEKTHELARLIYGRHECSQSQRVLDQEQSMPGPATIENREKNRTQCCLETWNGRLIKMEPWNTGTQCRRKL